jgi:RHS repeat-associated protein
MVSDQLGTPRMIADKSGSLVGVKRHDYLPFGEELFGGAPSQPGLGGRTTTQGYASDSTRQKFTQKERDIETGLDYFGARYYGSTQGRFTSVDPGNYQAMQDPSDPQSWNAYAYVNNNPLSRTDPDGKGILERIRNAWNGYGFLGISFHEWRELWIAKGMPWSSKGRAAPEGWNPEAQLHKLEPRGAHNIANKSLMDGVETK